MKQFYGLIKKVPILGGVCVLGLGLLSIYFLDLGEDFTITPVLLRVLLSFVCIAFLFMISGDKVLVASGKNVGKAFKGFIPLILYSVLIGAVVFFSTVFGKELADNVPSVLFWGTLEMLGVGFFEELTFRAVLNDAILYQFRDKKGVFVAIGFISCFLFGVVHVLGADVSTPLNMAQAVLKTVTTGVWGFIMLVVFWNTHNVMVCAIVHAFYDWCSALLNSLAATSTGEVGGYIKEGFLEVGPYSINYGYLAVVTYILQMIPMIIILLLMIPTIKKIDFKAIRNEW